MKVMTQFHERLRAQAETSQLAIRWRGLPARDRLALLWLGAFLLLVVLYLALWRPAERHLQSARQYFTEQRALHAYIQQQAPNVRQADAAAPQAQIDPAALQGMVTASAAQAGLSVERLDSEGEGAVQVALQPAPFAAAALAGAVERAGRAGGGGRPGPPGRRPGLGAPEPAGRVSGPWLGPAWAPAPTLATGDRRNFKNSIRALT